MHPAHLIAVEGSGTRWVGKRARNPRSRARRAHASWSYSDPDYSPISVLWATPMLDRKGRTGELLACPRKLACLGVRSLSTSPPSRASGHCYCPAEEKSPNTLLCRRDRARPGAGAATRGAGCIKRFKRSVSTVWTIGWTTLAQELIARDAASMVRASGIRTRGTSLRVAPALPVSETPAVQDRRLIIDPGVTRVDTAEPTGQFARDRSWSTCPLGEVRTEPRGVDRVGGFETPAHPRMSPLTIYAHPTLASASRMDRYSATVTRKGSNQNVFMRTGRGCFAARRNRAV